MVPAVKPVLLMYYGWLLVVTLGITETISWGVLYYAFAALLPSMRSELGWSLGEMTGAFSLALLLNGIAGIAIGRWLDRRGPRLLMTTGSCAGVLLVLAWSRVSDLRLFYLMWAAIGLVMAAVLYEPAFAVVTFWFERRRARALTVVTLFAGCASTIFLPLTSWLVRLQGWRGAIVTLAVILAAGTILPHALVLRRRPGDLGLAIDGGPASVEEQRAPGRARVTGLSVGEALSTKSFRWLALAFFLSIGVATAVRVQLVPYLVQRGLSIGTAAAFTGSIGAMQVFGRVVLGALSERVSTRVAAAVALGMQPLALIVLVATRDKPGLVVFVVLFGASYGAMALVRPALLAGLYGRMQYASIAGVLAFAVTLSQAGVPLAAGKAFDRLGSYDPILWAFVLLTALSAFALLRVR
jgi:MFS family permease